MLLVVSSFILHVHYVYFPTADFHHNQVGDRKSAQQAEDDDDLPGRQKLDRTGLESTTHAALSLDREDGASRDFLLSRSKQQETNYDNGRNSASRSTTRESALLENYNASVRIPPLWNCSSSPPSSLPLTKLVFVHIFKTAGSSMRTFLAAYGRYCHRSVALVVRCGGLSSRYLNETVWRDSAHHSCGLTYAYDPKSGRESSKGGKVGSEEFRRADIVGGHLPLGVHQSLPPQHRQKVQYITFVRDPLHKYVSGRVYSSRHNRNYTANVAVERIYHEISHRYSHGDPYDRYSSYLLAPWQRDDKPSSEQRLKRMQDNLVEMNVAIGVVERMSESFELLQYLVDDARELNRVFQSIQSNELLVRNKSPLSTSDLIRRLKARDPDFERQARVVLQNEYRLYDFAQMLHQRQYADLVLSRRRIK